MSRVKCQESRDRYARHDDSLYIPEVADKAMQEAEERKELKRVRREEHEQNMKGAEERKELKRVRREENERLVGGYVVLCTQGGVVRRGGAERRVGCGP